MPRLRNANTLITDLSQISEGDLIIYHGNLWDAIGTVTILDGAFRLLLDQGQFRPTGWSHFEYYSITNVYINNRQFMKISTHLLKLVCRSFTFSLHSIFTSRA